MMNGAEVCSCCSSYFQIPLIHDREGKFGRSKLKKGEVQRDKPKWPQSADAAGTVSSEMLLSTTATQTYRIATEWNYKAKDRQCFVGANFLSDICVPASILNTIFVLSSFPKK